MEIELELGASSMRLDDKGLSVYIARKHFTGKQWQRVCEKLAQAQASLKWLGQPFERLEQEGARWKRIPLDVFSLVVYILLVDPGHKLVQLLQAIDWHELDRRCVECYENGTRGARAYAPQVLFRMLLLMVLYGVMFESGLVEQIEAQMVWRWFCGLGVLSTTPTAATLCYFRQRLGPAKFEELVGWLIQQCAQAGLVSLEEGYFDFTGEQASATQLSPYERTVVLAKALSAYVAGLDNGSIAEEGNLEPILRQLVIEAAQAVMSEKHPSVEKLKPEQLSSSLERLEKRVARMPRGPRWWQQLRQALKNWRQQEPTQAQAGTTLLQQLAESPVDSLQRTQLLATLGAHLRQVGQALRPSVPHAWGDLSARVGTLSAGRTVCGYLVGYLVDGAHNIIVGLVSVPANIAQESQVKVVLDKTKRLLGRPPRRLGLDSAFDKDSVYLDLEGESIELFITSRNHRAPKGCLGPACFLINADGALCCPTGQPMRLKYGPYQDGRSVYEGAHCATCALQAECVPQGKQVRRFQVKLESHRRWLANRAKSKGDEGRHVLHQRFAREGVFGHGNTYHNGDRAPYRDGDMNAIADCLTVFALNLEKLAAHLAASPAAA
jgi:transposase